MSFSLEYFGTINSLLVLASLLVLVKYCHSASNSHPLAILRGPSSKSFLFGRLPEITAAAGVAIYEHWVSEYGAVFKVPIGLGKSRIVVCDSKAMAHCLSKDGFTFLRVPFQKAISKALGGPNMTTCDKEDHRRQRRAMTPAFSNSALRGVLHSMYDIAYKAKTAWDGNFESKDEVIIDVENWAKRMTLDVIGIAGFGHDFKAVDGEKSPLEKALDELSDTNVHVFRFFNTLGFFFPQVLYLPFGVPQTFRRIQNATSALAMQFLEQETSDDIKDQSILSLMLKGRTNNANFKLLREEVVGLGLFMFAAHETTSGTISWALHELALNQKMQDKLREELQEFSGRDPTWEQLMSGLPYLDAVILETIRLHPVVENLLRIASEDVHVPLSSPLKTAYGNMVDSIFIPKGSQVSIPICFPNVSESIWGPDAKQFVPERWLGELPDAVKDIGGYKHLYTFSEGPRICLGRVFAIEELKVVISVLIRNFRFELVNGPDTKVHVQRSQSIFRRFFTDGKPGYPMRVKQVVT